MSQADETRWMVFIDHEGKTGHRWWLWAFLGSDSVVFVLDPSRSHEVPEGHFAADAELVLVVDRYSAYKAMKVTDEGLKHIENLPRLEELYVPKSVSDAAMKRLRDKRPNLRVMR